MDVNRAGVCVCARTCARSLTLLWSWDFHLQPHAFPLGLSNRERERKERPLGFPFSLPGIFKDILATTCQTLRSVELFISAV